MITETAMPVFRTSHEIREGGREPLPSVELEIYCKRSVVLLIRKEPLPCKAGLPLFRADRNWAAKNEKPRAPNKTSY